MTGRLVPVAQYLTYPEAVQLYGHLAEMEVVAQVKSCGPPSFPYMEGIYFQLLIPEDTVAVAQPVLDLFSQKQPQNGNTFPACPVCASTAVAPANALPWYKKLYYLGTSVYRCGGCGHSFFT
ncbi:MAG: hypothetical protein ACO1OQ_08790 [Rufibacter sp.]